MKKTFSDFHLIKLNSSSILVFIDFFIDLCRFLGSIELNYSSALVFIDFLITFCHSFLGQFR